MALSCKYCDKEFGTLGNLNRHCRDVHNIDVNQYTYEKYFNKCNECKVSFAYIKDLRMHLEKDHFIKFEVEKKTFGNSESK